MMAKPMMTLTAALFAAMTLAPAASALPPLSDDARVQGEMTAGAVAYQISKHCPSISARLLRANGHLNKLKAYARGKGYSDTQIRALGDDAVAKDKLNLLRDTYLDQNGVSAGNADSYCALGYREIQAGSLTGRLLRAR